MHEKYDLITDDVITERGQTESGKQNNGESESVYYGQKEGFNNGSFSFCMKLDEQQPINLNKQVTAANYDYNNCLAQSNAYSNMQCSYNQYNSNFYTKI